MFDTLTTPISRYDDLHAKQRFDSAKGVADKLWTMSNWLFDEFHADAKEINKLNLDPMKDAISFFESTDFKNFSLRTHCRFLSYSVIVCSLERVVRKMYSDLSTYVNTEQSLPKLEERKKEIKELKTWRDKIAGHTSYADPKADNEAMQLTSLMQFFSSSWQATPPDFTKFSFGSGSWYVNGQPPNIQLPQIQWESVHKQMKEHYNKWIKMFEQLNITKSSGSTSTASAGS